MQVSIINTSKVSITNPIQLSNIKPVKIVLHINPAKVSIAIILPIQVSISNPIQDIIMNPTKVSFNIQIQVSITNPRSAL